MGLYDDPVLATLHGSGAGSTVGGANCSNGEFINKLFKYFS